MLPERSAAGGWLERWHGKGWSHAADGHKLHDPTRLAHTHHPGRVAPPQAKSLGDSLLVEKVENDMRLMAFQRDIQARIQVGQAGGPR